MTDDTIIHTVSGIAVNVTRPTAQSIRIQDIAHALSMSCRWGGHVTRFYSVAEHAVTVSHLVHKATGDAYQALAALHHDAHEAYLGDLITPVKNVTGVAWRELEYWMDHAICQALGIESTDDLCSLIVKTADRTALEAEDAALRYGRTYGNQAALDAVQAIVTEWPRCLTSHKAAEAYLERHVDLTLEIDR